MQIFINITPFRAAAAHEIRSKIKILLLSGKSNQQIATETGINVHKVGIYAPSARRMELASLQRIVSMVSETDLAMKYRYDSGYGNLEKLICSL